MQIFAKHHWHNCMCFLSPLIKFSNWMIFWAKIKMVYVCILDQRTHLPVLHILSVLHIQQVFSYLSSLAQKITWTKFYAICYQTWSFLDKNVQPWQKVWLCCSKVTSIFGWKNDYSSKGLRSIVSYLWKARAVYSSSIKDFLSSIRPIFQKYFSLIIPEVITHLLYSFLCWLFFVLNISLSHFIKSSNASTLD